MTHLPILRAVLTPSAEPTADQKARAAVAALLASQAATVAVGSEPSWSVTVENFPGYEDVMAECQRTGKPALVFVRCTPRRVNGFLVCRCNSGQLDSGVYVCIPGDSWPVANRDHVLDPTASDAEFLAALKQTRDAGGKKSAPRVVPATSFVPAPSYPRVRALLTETLARPVYPPGVPC